MTISYRTLLLTLGFSAVALSAQVSFAAAAQEDRGLADIVVTAQKRTENLQSTPIAVSAVNAEMIRDRGIASAADLTAVAPSLTAATSPSSSTNMQLYIRGIGDNDPILTSDSPVGVYVDGIILGRSAGSAFDILDLERVEVLRGPQGTLYGRNTIGGAVNLITAKPADDFQVDLNVGAGNYGYYSLKTSVDTGDIAHTGFKARMTYLHKERNGVVDDLNAPANQDPGAYALDAFRGAASFERGAFKIDYGFDWSRREGYAPAFQLTVVRPDVLAYLEASPLLGGTAPQVSTKRLKEMRLHQGLIVDRVVGHTITAELDLGGATIRSLTGFRKWRNTNNHDNLDGNAGLVGFTVDPAILAPPYPFNPIGVTPIAMFSTQNKRRQNQFSQEINILGDVGDHFEYVVGGYYFNEKAHEYNPQNFLLVLPSPSPIQLTPTVTIDSFGVPLSSLTDYSHRNKSAAAFAQGTYHITNDLSITGGIRYTHDKKHLTQRAPFVRDLKTSFERVNYAVSANWQATPDMLVYARTASGYKAGGFNARSVNSGFDPESLTSYEIGIKSDWLDRRLRFNATGFYATHSDVQLQQFQAGSGGASSVTVNAGKARYWGIEAELTAKPVEVLTLGANLGYTDRKYRQFLILDPITNQEVDVKDTAKFVVGASTTISAWVQWDVAEFNFGRLSVRGDYDYRSKVYYHPSLVGTPYNEEIAGKPRHIFNGRIALTDIELKGAQAELSLWGKNILNKKYRLYGIDFGGMGYAGNTYADPATYGVDFRLKF